MRVRSFVILGLLLAGLFSTVGPAGGAWPALTSQTTREEYVIWKSDGTKAVTGKARGYVSTTDSTDSGNQAQLTFNAAGGCSCWVWPDTMRNGNKLRSARYDLYWNDSLVVSSLFIKGNREAAGAVDDTATAANSVSTTDIQNLAVTAAKIDSGVVAGYHIEDGALTGADIASTSNLSVNSITIADSLHVDNITVVGDSLSTGLLIVSQQLDTPDIRCLGCDSIKVNQLTHFEQGIQVEDTLTARTQGATGGVIGIEAGDDPPTRAFLINSGYGATFTVDVVAPTFPGAVTSGNASSAGSFIVFDGSSNYATIQQPSIGSNPLIKLPTTWTDGQYLKASVSGSTITLSTEAPSGTGDITSVHTSNTWVKVDGDSLSGDPAFGLDVENAPAGADTFLVGDLVTGKVRFARGDGGGGGSGDVTGAGTLNAFFTVTDSLGPVPKFGPNLTAFDARYVNEGAAGDITGVGVAGGLEVNADSLSGKPLLKVKSGGINSTHIATDGVGSAEIAANAVTSSELADSSVDTASILANAVTAARIAANAVTVSELADSSVNTASLLANSVTASRIAANSVGAQEVTTGAIADSGDVAANVITPRNIRATNSPSNGQAPVYRAGDFTWETPGGGSGDITGVGVAGGLEVNADSLAGKPLLKIKTAGVNSTHIGVDAVGATELNYGNIVEGMRTRPFYFEDWHATSSSYSASPGGWVVGAINSGTRAVVAAVDQHHPGLMKLSSSSSTNSGISWSTGSSVMAIGGGEQFGFCFSLTTTTDLVMKIGFTDEMTTGTPSDGVWIQINGTTLVGKVDEGISSVGTTGTSYTVTTATFYRVFIDVNADGSRVDFYVYNDAGSLLWTDYLTSPMPASGDYLGHGFCAYQSSAGNTELCKVDWTAQWFDGRSLTR